MSVPTGSDVVAVLEEAATDSPALAVDANLTLTVDGTPLAVSTADDRLRVQVPSITDAVSLFSTEQDRLPAIANTLATNGVTADIRIGDAVVAVLGAEAAPGRLSTQFSGAAVEIQPRAVLAAAVRLQ